jgi:hypothetical protein
MAISPGHRRPWECSTTGQARHRPRDIRVLVRDVVWCRSDPGSGQSGTAGWKVMRRSEVTPAFGGPIARRGRPEWAARNDRRHASGSRMGPISILSAPGARARASSTSTPRQRTVCPVALELIGALARRASAGHDFGPSEIVRESPRSRKTAASSGPTRILRPRPSACRTHTPAIKPRKLLSDSVA